MRPWQILATLAVICGISTPTFVLIGIWSGDLRFAATGAVAFVVFVGSALGSFVLNQEGW